MTLLRSATSTCEVYTALLRHLQSHQIAWLDVHEMARRSRFQMKIDRDRFTLAAALLRAVVAGRIGVPPAAVTIDRSCGNCGRPHGRPRLADREFEASISHSGDIVAVALTTGGPVGVDVQVVATQECHRLIPSVCTPYEQEFVGTSRDFYTYWTRKEAVLKATGQGLRVPMTDVVITPPEATPSLVALGDQPLPPCQMADLDLAHGCVGAVAALTAAPVEFATIEARGILSSG